MIGNHEFMKVTARRMGVSTADLEDFFARGGELAYEAGEWRFHESTPRRWAGVIISGEVELVRGLHGASRHLAMLGSGALIAESAFLDDRSHSTSAFTRKGAVVWQISRSRLAALRDEKPDLFYRIVARVAEGISERLRLASRRVADVDSPAHLIESVRVEHDSLGERELPAHVYYGVQTLRAMENFVISGVFVKNFDHMISALAYVKKAAALTNRSVLGYEKSAAIAREALETGASVYDLVLEKGWLTREKLNDLLRQENMTDPRKIPR